MSVSKNSKGDNIKNRSPKNEKGFINVGKEGTDLDRVNAAYDEFRIITPQSAHANKRRFEGIDTNVSVRNQFSRKDYEYFRPDERVPSKQKEIIFSLLPKPAKMHIMTKPDFASDYSS